MSGSDFCYVVDGQDFSDCVAIGKLEWAKNDIEDDDAGRDDGPDVRMHRKVRGKKRVLKVSCRDLPYERAHAFAVAHDKEQIEVTYLDLVLGVVTKTFYGTSISSTQYAHVGGADIWQGTKCEIVEV